MTSFFGHSLAFEHLATTLFVRFRLSTKADLRRVVRTGALTKEQFEAVPAERLRRSTAAANWMPRDGVQLG